MNARFNDPYRAQRELLSASLLLGGLPPALLTGLAAASRIVELSANQTLYQAGQPIREAYILFSGSVKRVVDVPGGASRVIEIVQNEQALGLGEVFGNTHYAAGCATITQTLLLAVDARQLREEVFHNPALAGRIIAAMARRQCATEFDAAGFHHGFTGAQRLLDYLLDQAGERAGLAGETTVILKASKKVIAARIGMTPESLSRNLRELSDNGVIVVEGRCVHIQNAALLDTVSGDARQRLSFSRKRKGGGRPLGKAISSGVLVNMCGRLRLLSQRMAVAWGSAVAGVAPGRARTKLRLYEKEFIRNLDKLDDLGLGGEPDSRLAAIKRLWPSYCEAMESEEITDAEHIFALSEELLDAANGLTVCAAELAGIPEAHYVNTAGRNRMLSQQICKLFLFHDWGSLNDRIGDLSRHTCREFESNLQELLRAAGSQAELAAQLDVVASQWQRFVRALCPDLSHAGKLRHARLVLTEGERLLRCVDTTVKLFERLAK